MAFIGNTPTTQAFTPAIDYFSGNASTTAFTLSRPVASVAQVQAVISNVPQNPGDAFTVSGSTITFTSAPPSGTNNIYVYYTSPITQVVTPSDGTVGTSQISSSLMLSQANGGTGTTTGYYGFKNRIINGAMVIDQRNAGASVTPTTNGTYTLDRWAADLSQSSKFSIQQNAGSVTPPTGFSKYLGVTSTSAYTVGSTENFLIHQAVEGFNFADLGFGTASAATVTLSFWVRSSLTGTFGGSLTNATVNRCYPFSFTISSANTWEQKSVTITGDTTGTWVGATNGIGCYLFFNLGTGSTKSGTANAWSSSEYYAPTGATSVVGTNGATFYITGVQLEKGSTATSFDYRPYGTELALCQRYYYQYASANTDFQEIVTRSGLTFGDLNIQVPVSMRATPTASLGSSPYGRVVAYDSAFSASTASVTGFAVGAISSLNNIHITITYGSVTAAAGLYGFSFDTLGTSAGIGLSSEL